MTKLSELKKYIAESLVILYEDIEEFEEVTERKFTSFYNMGFTNYGDLCSEGNDSDIYQDGFDNGVKQGKLEILEALNKLLEKSDSNAN